MAKIRVANLPKAKDESVLEKQVNREELEEGRELVGLGLDNSTNANFVEFKSNRSSAKLERLRVREVPTKAQKDAESFKEFIVPLMGDSELLDRTIVLLEAKEEEVVLLREVPIELPPARLPAPASSGPRTSAFDFVAAKKEVLNRGAAPDSFLNELVAWASGAPDEIFVTPRQPTPNTRAPNIDIYDMVKGELGPYRSLLHRKAVMLEVMRVLAGFESSWDWTEGRDVNNAGSFKPETTEAGAFQVSANSLFFGQDLKDLVKARAGNLGPITFQRAMKEDHPLAMEFIARLLRHTDRHNGPVNREEINPFLLRDAVKEFQAALKA